MHRVRMLCVVALVAVGCAACDDTSVPDQAPAPTSPASTPAVRDGGSPLAPSVTPSAVASSPPATSSPVPSPSTSPSASASTSPSVSGRAFVEGTGTLVFDDLTGTTAGDCVVAGSNVAVGPIADDTIVRISLQGDLYDDAGDDAGAVAIAASSAGGMAVRVEGAAVEGASAWEAIDDVVVGVAAITSDGHGTLTLAAEVDPARAAPSLQAPRLPPTPTPSSSRSTDDETEDPQPLRRPRPRQAEPKSTASPRLVQFDVACRVTTAEVD